MLWWPDRDGGRNGVVSGPAFRECPRDDAIDRRRGLAGDGPHRGVLCQLAILVSTTTFGQQPTNNRGPEQFCWRCPLVLSRDDRSSFPFSDRRGLVYLEHPV